MYRFFYIVLACFILLLYQCGLEEKPGFTPVLPAQKIHTFAHPFDSVWNSLLELLEKQEIYVNIMDKKSGTLMTEYKHFRKNSPLFDQILYPEKDEKLILRARYDIGIAVVAIDSVRTSVTLNVRISKYSRPFVGYYAWRDQPSNGYIETNFFADLEKELLNK